jgi:hypothetical protein
VVIGSDDHTVLVIEIVTGREVARFVYGDRVTAVAFSPDEARNIFSLAIGA